MNDRAKEKRKEYYRKWRKNNKEKIKKYNSNYWERKAIKENRDNKGE